MSAVTKMSARSGVVHVGIRLVPMLHLGEQLEISRGQIKKAYAKYGFALNAFIASEPSRTNTHTL